MSPTSGQGRTKSSSTGATVPAMDNVEDRQRMGRHGTDLPSVDAVDLAVKRLVSKQWGGWSVSDRQDLQQVVLVKYFAAFGRDRLPDNRKGDPDVPTSWLIKVIRNAGVDFHRQREARPADPFDFAGPDSFGVERLQQALNPQPNLSTAVAQRVDSQRVLKPALAALGDAYPMDVKLIVWRFVQDRDLEAIGKILGKSPDATKKAVQRAVKRLRDIVTSNSASISD